MCAGEWQGGQDGCAPDLRLAATDLCQPLCVPCVFSRVQLCDRMDSRSPPGSSVHGLFEQEHWSGLPFPSPGDLPDPGSKPTFPMSPALVGGFLSTVPPGKPLINCALIWGLEGRRGLGLSPLGGATQYQCPPAWPCPHPPSGPALWLPTQSLVPRFRMNLDFPTGRTEAATGYVAHSLPPTPQLWPTPCLPLPNSQRGWRTLIQKP